MSGQRPGCPGLRACRLRNAGCGHAARVDDWRELWQAWLIRCESENPGMYPTEVREWKGENPPVTFRDYLLGMRRA